MLKKTLATVSLLAASGLVLAGCASTTDEPDATSNPAPSVSESATPEATETPAETTAPEETTEESELQIPLGGNMPTSTDVIDEAGSTMYTFTGGAAEVANLKPLFEEKGFIWNDFEGSNTNVMVSGTDDSGTVVNMIIEVQPDAGTYTYTILAD